MAQQSKFSALRLGRKSILLFQNIKFVVESVRLRKMTNDELCGELIECFMSSHPEVEEAYKRMTSSTKEDEGAHGESAGNGGTE